MCSARPMPARRPLSTQEDARPGLEGAAGCLCLAVRWKLWPSDALCRGRVSKQRKKRDGEHIPRHLHRRGIQGLPGDSIDFFGGEVEGHGPQQCVVSSQGSRGLG